MLIHLIDAVIKKMYLFGYDIKLRKNLISNLNVWVKLNWAIDYYYWPQSTNQLFDLRHFGRRLNLIYFGRRELRKTASYLKVLMGLAMPHPGMLMVCLINVYVQRTPVNYYTICALFMKTAYLIAKLQLNQTFVWVLEPAKYPKRSKGHISK